MGVAAASNPRQRVNHLVRLASNDEERTGEREHDAGHVEQERQVELRVELLGRLREEERGGEDR